MDLNSHAHPEPYISFLLRGSYCEETNRASFSYEAGAVVFHPRGERHSDRFGGSGARILNLAIDSAWIAQQGLTTTAGAKRQNLPYVEALATAFALLIEGSCADAAKIEDAAFELMSFVGEQEGMSGGWRPGWLKKAEEFIHDAYADPEGLSLTTVAQHCGVHPVHLARSLRRYTGRTYLEHVREVRVKRSLRLLMDTDRHLAEIAHGCGFSDHSHFCRTLKRITGLSPSELRARL